MTRYCRSTDRIMGPGHRIFSRCILPVVVVVVLILGTTIREANARLLAQAAAIPAEGIGAPEISDNSNKSNENTSNSTEELVSNSVMTLLGQRELDKLEYRLAEAAGHQEFNDVLTEIASDEPCVPGYERDQDGICYELLPTPIP